MLVRNDLQATGAGLNFKTRQFNEKGIFKIIKIQN